MGQIPDLIDNQQHTLGEVLVQAIEQARSPALWVATAYFNLDGLERLGDAVEQVRELRLLIGTEPDQAFLLTQRLWRELEQKLALLSPHAQQLLERWNEFLMQDRVRVRWHKPIERGRVLHSKAYLILDRSKALGFVGSSNFTGAGLTTNLELNAVLKQRSATDALKRWYEAIWQQSADYKADLLALLQNFTRTLSPYEVYVKVLYESYRDRLEGDLREQDGKPSPIALADFQRDGYHAAREILEQYGGVLIADSVGLGKTYLALRLLDDYAYQQRQTALVICPAALRETAWKPALEQHAIPHRIESMEQISKSNTPLEEFAQYPIIVIDESHNFRTPSSNRWRNLFEIVRRARACYPDQFRLILLTATPVNNSVYDLYHQIRLLTQDDKEYFLAAGIENLESYFRNADESRETLYELLEAISVRRSRVFIRKHYPDAEIDGKRIHFPQRIIHSVNYNLQEVYGDNLYRQIAEAIENLNLAPYQIDSYHRQVVGQRSSLSEEEWKQIESALCEAGLNDRAIADLRKRLSKQKNLVRVLRVLYLKRLERKAGLDEEADLRKRLGEQSGLVGLLRVLYLKRLESSVEALRNSLRHQKEFQKRFLHALQRGKLLTSKDYRRLLLLESADDEAEDDFQAFLNALEDIDPDQYDLDLIAQAVESDLRVLEGLLDALERIPPDADAKLQTLKTQLQGELRDKKVLIFSYYKDTALYLYNYLCKQLSKVPIALVSSKTPMDERKPIVQRFSPQSNRFDLSSEAEIQILIATDALSEGQNLQDAGVIINYDLHWNPVRMVQRIGRIDRIGSLHNAIDVYNFIPEDSLEDLLGLMERLRTKLDAINRSVGLDASVLGEAPNPMDFNTLKRIAEEDAQVLDTLESESELTIGEFLLEDLMQFLKGLGEERLSAIPLGRGTARYAPAGASKGFFAAFRDVRTERHYWLFLTEDGKYLTRKLEAIRPIRCEANESPAPLPSSNATEQKLTQMRDHLVQQINRAANQIMELGRLQKQVLLRLQTLPSSSLRNELIAYFSRPLPQTALNDLRPLWRKAQTMATADMLRTLKQFADSHPHLNLQVERLSQVEPEDLECIAWMWVL